MVEVDRKHFYVERQLLAHHSAIFRDLIQDIWHGDEPVTLHLGYEEYGADAATFLCYVECIRSGCKQIPCTARKPLNEQDKEQGHDEYMLLCQVYVFSARVQDQVVQNTVMDALLHKFHEVDVNSMHWLPSDVVITYAYSRTEAGSPLRRFIADTYIWAGTEDHLRQNPATVHKGFFVDIAAAYLRKINDEGRDCKIPDEVKSCDYHVHVEGVECASRKRKREEDQRAVGPPVPLAAPLAPQPGFRFPRLPPAQQAPPLTNAPTAFPRYG